MSRSRYRPKGSRFCAIDQAEWYAFKRRRDDLRTRWGRVRVYGSRAIRNKKKRAEDTFFRLFMAGRGPAITWKTVVGVTPPTIPGWS